MGSFKIGESRFYLDGSSPDSLPVEVIRRDSARSEYKYLVRSVDGSYMLSRIPKGFTKITKREYDKVVSQYEGVGFDPRYMSGEEMEREGFI